MQTKQTHSEKTTGSLDTSVEIPSAVQQKENPLGTLPPEFGGRKGAEATRFGDWELNGKCVDF